MELIDTMTTDYLRWTNPDPDTSYDQVSFSFEVGFGYYKIPISMSIGVSFTPATVNHNGENTRDFTWTLIDIPDDTFANHNDGGEAWGTGVIWPDAFSCEGGDNHTCQMKVNLYWKWWKPPGAWSHTQTNWMTVTFYIYTYE